MRTLLALLSLLLLAGCGQRESAIEATATLDPQLFAAPMLASFHATLSGTEGAFTLLPDRSAAAVGDAYHEIGLSRTLLEQFSGAVRLMAVERTAPGTLRLTWRIRHPFPLNKRPDLHAFNLKMHIESPATASVGGYPVDPGRLIDADGYSRVWVSQLRDGMVGLVPYAILSEDASHPTFDPQAPVGWNVFAAEGVYESTMDLALPEPGITLPLNLYLTADFGQSATLPTRPNPAYELPRFAGRAPWKVQVSEQFNGLGGGAPETYSEYILDIWHWSQGAGIGTDVIAPLNVSASDIRSDQDIDTLDGTGLDPTPLSAVFTIHNLNMVPEGDYWGAVKVGTESGPASGLQDDLITPFTVDEYSTWQLFPIHVQAPPPVGDPPNPQISLPCSVLPIQQGVAVTFDATGTFDTENLPEELSYEWDADYDGSTFSADASGLNTTYLYDSPGMYTLALQVTDLDNNRAMVQRDLTVLPPGWLPPHQLDEDPAIGDAITESNQCADGLFLTPAGVPWLAVRDPNVNEEGMMLVSFGEGCPPMSTTIDVGSDRLPEVVVLGNYAYLLWAGNGDELTSMRLDLTTFEEERFAVFDGVDLLSGSELTDWALVIDPGTGNLMAVGDLYAADTDEDELWACEKNPAGDWSAPFLAGTRDGTLDTNFSHLALGISLGSVVCVWTDLAAGPGNPSLHKLVYACSSFGTSSFDEAVDTNLVQGELSDLSVRLAPDSGLVGVLGRSTGLGYLRMGPFSLEWTEVPLGGLTGAQYFPRIVMDETGLVTTIWAHVPTGSSPTRLVGKQFAYDASPSTIADGVVELVQPSTDRDILGVQLGIDPAVKRPVAAWVLGEVANPDIERELWGSTR